MAVDISSLAGALSISFSIFLFRTAMLRAYAGYGISLVIIMGYVILWLDFWKGERKAWRLCVCKDEAHFHSREPSRLMICMYVNRYDGRQTAT